MSKHPRGRQPYIPPVTRLELVRTDSKTRWIAIAVLLAFGLTAIAVGLFSMLNTEQGWVTVEAAPEGVSCSGDFLFRYDFSDDGGAASARNKELTKIYTQATEDAFLMFSPDVEDTGMGNVKTINANPNHPVTIHPVLYHALMQLVEAGNRMLYLGPVYVEYDRVFQSESDVLASEYDPGKNPQVQTYLAQVTAFASDPAHIRLAVLDDNQVMLEISQEYLNFAQENGIVKFLDFGWMKNAFIADYLADTLTEAGYTNGYLASHNGFTRNLDSRGGEYTFNLFDRRDGTVYLPGVLKYSQPVSIVFLRNYPMDELDRWQYYAYEDGKIVTSMIDPADGMSKSAASNLVSYSNEAGCTRVLLEMIPHYVKDGFDEEAVQAMAEKGIYSVWFRGTTLCHSEPDAAVELIPEASGSLYTLAEE